MKYLIYSLFLLFLLPVFVRAQDSAVIYMNSDFEAVNDIKTAVIKRHAVIKNDRYYISDQYVDGRKIMKGEYNSVNPWTEDGPFIFYDHKGNKYAEGNFVNGAMDGQWVYYDSSGSDTVFYKKEWMEIVNANEPFKYKGGPSSMSEELYEYIQKNTHYPPRLLMDCKSLNKSIEVLLDKNNQLFLAFPYSMETDFRIETFRLFQNAPKFLLNENGDPKNIRYLISMNFICNRPTGRIIAHDTMDCSLPSYVFVDEQATFKGGSLEKFREWIQMNLMYPPEAVEEAIQGRITFQFVVTTDGYIDCIKILRSAGKILDKEALRVLNSSPQWQPAKIKNTVVNQQFVMPVIFQLQ